MTDAECKRVATAIVAFRTDDKYSVEDIMGQLRDFNAEVCTYKHGDVCVRAGTPARTVAYVLSGILHQRIPSTLGNDILMRAIYPGHFAAFSLIYNPVAVHPVDYVAFTDAEVVVMDVERIRAWRQDPRSQPFFELIGRLLCDGLYESWTKTMVLGGKNIGERVRRYLTIRMEREKTRTIVVPGTESDFANYLCVNVCALSRALNRLRAAGKIEYKRNVITVLE